MAKWALARQRSFNRDLERISANKRISLKLEGMKRDSETPEA